MHRRTFLCLLASASAATAAVLLAAAPVAALAAAPEEKDVQGLYEGAYTEEGAAHKVEARVVATGDGGYTIFVREPQPGGEVKKYEFTGTTEGDAVRFAGTAEGLTWTGTWSPGRIAGASSEGGPFELKRIERKPPTLGAKPPAGAVVLLAIGEKTFGEVLVRPDKKGNRGEWKAVEDGGTLVPKGGFESKRTLDGSFRLHVEFQCPLMPKARGQGRGNSGVYLPNGNEIQVLDSFGMTTYTGGGCGGIYKYKDPDAFDAFSLASLPPLEWQTYDIEYRVTKENGKPAGKPVVTVVHNGVTIHDRHELKNDARPGRLFFQDHGNAVHYRNIWVVPME